MVEEAKIKSIHHVNAGIIQSPAFEAQSPTIVNRDLIPGGRLADMAASWGRHFEATEIRIDKVFDVYVTAEGLVFTHDKKLIEDTKTQHSSEEIERAYHRICSLSEVPQIMTSCLLMRKRGDDNYGHWLVETMPKLSIARSVCQVSGVAVPLLEGRIHEVIRDSLRMADRGLGTHIFPIEKHQVTFFKELIIVSGATNHGVFMSPLMVREIEGISKGIQGTGTEKVYVSRRGSPRSLTEDEAIEANLSKRGFSILHPGYMTFEQQIAAFKNAELVVGVIGAGMTNIVFAKKGARVLNLTPATMPDTFFYFLSVHKQQEYRELRLPVKSMSWDEKISASADEIIAAAS